MKRFITLALCAMSLASCSKDMSPMPDFPVRKDIILTRAQQDVVNSGNVFTFDLLSKIYPKETKQEVFFSPFSIQVALSMLANGAAGDTYKQIVGACGISNYEPEQINDAYGTLVSALLSADSSTRLAITNSLWLGNSFPVIPDFQQALKSYYGAESGNLDFSSPEAVDAINSWCKRNTQGMIPKVIDELDPRTAFIIANALYFKGVWSEKFNSRDTATDKFFTSPTQSIDKPFMHGEIPCKFAYSESLMASLCELPFGNKAYVLDILLPDEQGAMFGNFVSGLSGAKWQDITARLESAKMDVIIPKIELSFSAESESMITSLKELGIVDAFDAAKADFGKLSEVSTFINLFVHKAYFKMDEDGAVAAAVSIGSGMVTSGPPPKQFRADHPFVFAIRETSTGAILFAGTYRGLR